MKELKKLEAVPFYYDVNNQLMRFIYNISDIAFEAGDAARDGITRIEELEIRRSFMREKLIEAWGGLPSSETPLNAEIKGIIQCNGYRIEKLIYESRPKSFITANLYIPDNLHSKAGAILFLCGHHGEGKHIEEYQIVCQYLVSTGLIVLAQDPIGQGERMGYYEDSIKSCTVGFGTDEHDYAGSQCLPVGDCLARYFVHDAMRGVDYLLSRAEVDSARIGVTGNSGGGLQTCMMMVCDQRIAAAAPATFLMNRQSYMYAGGPQDSEQNWLGMTSIGFDHEDFLLAMAPRPVLVLAAEYDVFPVEAVRRTCDRTKRFWSMFGKSENMVLFVDRCHHHYTEAMAQKAAEFFSCHLLGKEAMFYGTDILPHSPSILRCTNSGQVRSEIQGARFVFDENCERINEFLKERSMIETMQRRENAEKWLLKKVHYRRRECGLEPRSLWNWFAGDFYLESCLWWSQEGLFNHALIIRRFDYRGMDIPVTVAIWDGGTKELTAHMDWIRSTCNSGRAVMVLDVSGTGSLTPNPINGYSPSEHYGSVHRFACDLIWLGDSLAAMRVFDVLRSLDMIDIWPGLDKNNISVHAWGRPGLYGLLAAFLDTRIKNIDETDGMESYYSWVTSRHYNIDGIISFILPGIIKNFDLPDIRNWLSNKLLNSIKE